MKYILLLFLLVSCKKEIVIIDEVKRYHNYLIELQELNKKNADNKTIRIKSLVLYKQGVVLADYYIGRHEECKESVYAIVDNLLDILELDLEEIEKGYHGGEALPPSAKRCYSPRDVLVHPLTVYILAKNYELKEGQRDQIESELFEIKTLIESIIDRLTSAKPRKQQQ